jgi:glucokinase
MSDVVLALDVGGTKLAAGLVDAEGTVLRSARTPTPQGADDEALWGAVESLAAEVLGESEVVGVGVGCGGPMVWPDGVVSPLSIPGWRSFPLRDRVARTWPGVPVRLHNDAPCLAAAEHWRGAGRGHDHMLGMVVSTGVGGGLVLGGRLVDGATGNAGHIGHVVVERDGPECACGGRGCLEAVASGPRIAAWASAHGWRDGATGSGRELAEDAAAGDALALRAMTRAGEALGVAIASAVHLCDVPLVVVGGGLSQAGASLFEPLDAALRRHARMGFARDARVVPAELGQDAGIVGAAALVLCGDRYWSGD